MTYLLRDEYLSLRPDRWRESNPFSDDIAKIHDVIFHPFVSKEQKSKALRLWLQKGQPCVFGRIAAQMDRLHIVFLSESELHLADEEIKEFLQVERAFWKQRCLRNEAAEHGLLLIAASPRLAFAAPSSLYKFSQIIRELYSPEITKDLRGNDIAWEDLYLEHPQSKTCFRFKFSLDYFGAQGDGRWWHDHRIPGGIAYTANSIGHMARTREWYEGKGAQTEWVVKVAMETVDEAAVTQWGKAITLRELRNGRPYAGTKCPFSTTEKLKPRLQGRDWSGYMGTLSTDHSLRKELFWDAPEPPPDLPKWNMDFTYLYDESTEGFKKFMGEEIPCEDVINRIGEPSERRILAGEVDVQLHSLEAKLQQLQSEWADDLDASSDIG